MEEDSPNVLGEALTRMLENSQKEGRMCLLFVSMWRRVCWNLDIYPGNKKYLFGTYNMENFKA